MPRSKGKHGRRLVALSDDPDALVIDPSKLPDVKGTLLHFHELLPGDMFTTEFTTVLWNGVTQTADDLIEISTNIYLGEGHYFSMSPPDARIRVTPGSTLLQRLSGLVCSRSGKRAAPSTPRPYIPNIPGVGQVGHIDLKDAC